jgi:Protein of unknown function (DUF1501)
MKQSTSNLFPWFIPMSSDISWMIPKGSQLQSKSDQGAKRMTQQELSPLSPTPSRRNFLLQTGTGFGALALSGMMAEQAAADKRTESPMAPKPTHHPVRAKSVIFLFMEGGPSQIDTFDPKPALNKLAGQQIPDSFDVPITPMGEGRSPLLASPRTWKQHGQGGLWVSEWLPHIATCADDIAVIRSCWGNGINHSGGVSQMNTGSLIGGRPSLGSWMVYGLGTENQNLPAFVVMTDSNARIFNGPRNWGAAFMPALYQGAPLDRGDVPIPNLATPEGISESRQSGKLSLLNEINREHADQRRQQSELDARIKSYELAARMQTEAPEAVDISRETEATREMYGLNVKETAVFGQNCLLARRLVERGVRFVQLYHGAGSKWDSHSAIEKKHPAQCRSMDKCVAGLLNDLKQRGLLESTLVVWGGEFGRTPMSEKGDGRDHNPTGFTMWMAGGGVKGGQTIGATDELGLHAVEDRLHVRDLHATILNLMGLDHMKLTFQFHGRQERPTQNEGSFLKRLITG